MLMFDIFILPSQPNDLNPLNETQKKKNIFFQHYYCLVTQ